MEMIAARKRDLDSTDCSMDVDEERKQKNAEYYALVLSEIRA
jgi:hypothetical protein